MAVEPRVKIELTYAVDGYLVEFFLEDELFYEKTYPYGEEGDDELWEMLKSMAKIGIDHELLSLD